jgi:hypothetical protein
MIADFGVRFGFGLAALLVATSSKTVPLTFFRIHCHVILGLLVLAVLDISRSAGMSIGVGILLVCSVLAYAAAVTWGIGLPRIAMPATLLIAVGTAVWHIFVSRAAAPGLWVFNSASRLVSGFLLGATLTAMLLGHHYLTAPTMSIDPLKRFVRFIGWGLGARGFVALLGLALAHSGIAGMDPGSLENGSTLLLMMRWGMGFVGPVLATILAWKTVQIRSTQSATGILYVAMTLLLVGELTSLISAPAGGLIG